MHPMLNVTNFYEPWTSRTRTLFFLNAVTKNLTKHLKRWQNGPCVFVISLTSCSIQTGDWKEMKSTKSGVLPQNYFPGEHLNGNHKVVWKPRDLPSSQLWGWICVVALRGVCFIVGSCWIMKRFKKKPLSEKSWDWDPWIMIFVGSHDFDMIIGNIMQISKFRLSRLEQ